MSNTSPMSYRIGPATTNTLVHRRYIIIHIVIIWFSSIFPLYMLFSHFLDYMEIDNTKNRILWYIITPLHLLLWYLVWVIMAILISAFFLKIANLIHKPREGYFPRDPKDKDFKYWSIRAVIKKFALWLCYSFWIPWFSIFACKLYGMKITWKTTVFDAWVDTEFVECGKNVTIGQGSAVMGTMITRDWLIIKKTILHDNVIIGGGAIVSPGTIINENTIVGAATATMIGQELKPNFIYMGSPAKEFRENKNKFDTSYTYSSKIKEEEKNEDK